MAHRLTRRLAQVRKEGLLPCLRPDGKSQVTVCSTRTAVRWRVDTVVLSTQHSPEVSPDADFREDMLEQVITPGDPRASCSTSRHQVFLSTPPAALSSAAPRATRGLTGRKIIVDTYGGYAPHGGGAFSGKDPTKVDRSAAYAARYVAKNIVAAGLARRCEIAAGLCHRRGASGYPCWWIPRAPAPSPTSAWPRLVREAALTCGPTAIITRLDLRRPIYRQTAAYGHFGRTDVDLPWERLDYVDALKRELSC